MDTVVGTRTAAAGSKANSRSAAPGNLRNHPDQDAEDHDRSLSSLSRAVVAVGVARWTSGGVRCTPVLPYRDRAIAPRPRLPGCRLAKTGNWPLSGSVQAVESGLPGESPGVV